MQKETFDRLSQAAYWVGMAKAVSRYCSHCFNCQTAKAQPHTPVPLQPVIASRPWELVAVDVLKVPMSQYGNQYILVAQGYFSKKPIAMKGRLNCTNPAHQKNCTQIRGTILRAISCQNSAKHLRSRNLALLPTTLWEIVW